MFKSTFNKINKIKLIKGNCNTKSIHYLQDVPIKTINIINYKGTPSVNIGDAIQTIALTQLLAPLRYNINYINRQSQLVDFNSNNKTIINGWHNLSNEIPKNINLNKTNFIGFYTSNKNWIPILKKCTIPVGCRDPETLKFLQNNGIDSYLSGCFTLTLPTYSGIRKGKYIVDGPHKPGYENLSHTIGRNMSWDDQLYIANYLLEKYKTAEEVLTDRLHVYLPCLAFGTPVKFLNPEKIKKDSRYSILNLIKTKNDINIFRTILNENILKYETT